MSKRDRTYFDQLYASTPDPWQYRTSGYERRKYDVTVACLTRTDYPTGLEVGCSIGLLTRRLAARVERMSAIDVSPVALDLATSELADVSNVELGLGHLPDGLPDGPFDLVVISEVLYYLDVSERSTATEEVASRLVPGGDLLLVHWFDGVRATLHEPFIGHSGLRHRVQHRDESFTLDLLSAGMPGEVAVGGGLA